MSTQPDVRHRMSSDPGVRVRMLKLVMNEHKISFYRRRKMGEINITISKSTNPNAQFLSKEPCNGLELRLPN